MPVRRESPSGGQGPSARPPARPLSRSRRPRAPPASRRPVPSRRPTDAAFGNAVHDIWLAVTAGNPEYALPAFFPEKAYEQVKAIADPECRLGRTGSGTTSPSTWPLSTSSWPANRDAHQGHRPDSVRAVDPEGACSNSLGYWHVPGSRVVYRQAETTYSFGIASFISWRGDWYLVHLGALSRSGAYGIVDDPEAGRGRLRPARRLLARPPGQPGASPRLPRRPRTDPVSSPLDARTSQITVLVPACHATESGYT